MGANGKQYTAGTWVVKEGSEAEFIARWKEFTGWSLANAPGAHHFIITLRISAARGDIPDRSVGQRGDDRVRKWRGLLDGQSKFDENFSR